MIKDPKLLLGRLADITAQLRLLLPALVETLDELAAAHPDYDDTPIDELEIGVRAHGALKNRNIRTIGQLRQIDDRDLLRTPNFGKKSLAEVHAALRIYDNGNDRAAILAEARRGKNTPMIGPRLLRDVADSIEMDMSNSSPGKPQ